MKTQPERIDGQLDVYEVLELVEEEGLMPEQEIVLDCADPVMIGVDCARNDIDAVVVKVGMEFVVMVDGRRVNDRKLWSQIECHAFIDGLRARA